MKSSLLPLAASLLLLCATTEALAKKAPPLCTGDRRYVVTGDAIMGALPPQTVVIAGDRISTSFGCLPVGVKRVRTKKGTRLRARFVTCGNSGRVRLQAMIDGGCATMRGSLKTKRPKTTARFAANLSACGDGVVDGAETCEPPGTTRCNDQCQQASSPTRAPVCGNGVVESPEQCDDGNQNDGDGCDRTCGSACLGPFASTWEAIQQIVFARRGCTEAACHGASAQGGLDLSPTVAYANLIHVPAQGESSQHRVFPGSQDTSFLWRKLAKSTINLAGVPKAGMPFERPPIPVDELDAVGRWIRAGAPETGVVESTDALLNACLPPAGPPTEITAPDPPAREAGVQLHGPRWNIRRNGEDEVCFATYYDYASQIPAESQIPCPEQWGGPSKQCFAYRRTELTQSRNSHHSIIHLYKGIYDITHESFGPFTCRGGPADGASCNPQGIGQPAPAGADCGPGGGCGGRPVRAANCVFYGPPDYGIDFGGGTETSPQFAGSQAAYFATTFASGVYATLPVRGIVVWNSHAFNLTSDPATNEQWLNLYFAAPVDRQYPVQSIFDAHEIFVQNVPPFETRWYCATHVLPPRSRLFELSSHYHKRGKLFRVFAPGVQACTDPECPPDRRPILTTTDYTDPAQVRFDPPVVHDGNVASRTYTYCALYDNGATNPAEVKRFSTSPSPPPPLNLINGFGGPCKPEETACLAGPHKGELCNLDDSRCDSLPGAGDGLCDACPLKGGVTTEDEMFILLGFYYQVP
jgi:cysteine-rich repeat protein